MDRELTRRRPTVGQWLLLFVLGFFLGPLCVSNLWGYLQSRRYLTEAAFQNIRNVAALEASETREFVRAAEELVASIVAGNQHLFSLVRGLGAVSNDVEERAPLRSQLALHLQAKATERRTVESFYVLSPSGVLLASSDPTEHPGVQLDSSRCFQIGRQAAGTAGLEYEPADDHANHPHEGHEHTESTDHDVPRIIVTAPITDEDAFLGVFCGRFTFDVHRSMLVAHKERTREANLYLVDKEGRIICGSFEELHGSPLGQTFAYFEQSRARYSEAWEGRYEDASGTEVILAFAPVPNMPWGIAVEVPVSHALAELERLKWQAVGASTLLAAALGLALFVSWRTFVRPLRALSSTSDRIASGAPGATVAPHGPRELVELAVAFNRMSLALKESHETLELRIASRTQELRESQEFLELLLDSIDQRVIVVDQDYLIVKANAAALRMRGRSLVGSRCYEVFEGATTPPDDYPARKTLETGQPAFAERSQITAQGREAVYVETYPVLDSEKRVQSVIEIARVITGEKRVHMQMIHQEKMAAFGQLAAGVAHEIGNPLAAIESQLRLLQDDPSRSEETLGVIRGQVARMARLLRELVDFTRRRRDTVALASINQVIEDVVRVVEHDPRARKIQIVKNLGTGLPGIRTKEDQIVQILVNLALNAFDAIKKEGTVTFESVLEAEEVVIRVRDTGPGVSESARAHLFEPFFTTKQPGHGTGLGLFVSRGIVESLGGRLELERPGPGDTTFTLRLRTERAGRHGNGHE